MVPLTERETMANREGRKTVAAELPDDLYQRLEWCIGRTPADDPTVVLKRMSDVIRWMLDDSFTNCFDAAYQIERKAAEAKAKREAKKATNVNA
jgi:hypothetical protein